jgi:hypothetical protein
MSVTCIFRHSKLVQHGWPNSSNKATRVVQVSDVSILTWALLIYITLIIDFSMVGGFVLHTDQPHLSSVDDILNKFEI